VTPTSISHRFPMRRILAIVGTTLGLARFGFAMDLSEVRERVRVLQARMFKMSVGECLPREWQDCVGPETRELRALIREYSLWKLNQSQGGVEALTKDLRSVNDVGYFEELAKLGTPAKAREGFSSVFRKSGLGGELIVTVNPFVTGMLATPQRDVVIQGFRKMGKDYVFAAEAGESAFGVMGFTDLEVLQSPIDQMWLLVSGQIGGFMGDLVRARIYTFDGLQFRALWAPEDREGMQIHVEGNRLKVLYLGPRMDNPRGFTINHLMEEELSLSPTAVVRILLVDHGEGVVPLRKQNR
jgi:hypothetical protein